MLKDGHFGRFGGVFYWQRFVFRRVSPSRTPCGGSSARCRPRTSSRKSSATPSISSQAKSAALKKPWRASAIARRCARSRIKSRQTRYDAALQHDFVVSKHRSLSVSWHRRGSTHCFLSFHVSFPSVGTLVSSGGLGPLQQIGTGLMPMQHFAEQPCMRHTPYSRSGERVL